MHSLRVVLTTVVVVVLLVAESNNNFLIILGFFSRHGELEVKEYRYLVDAVY